MSSNHHDNCPFHLNLGKDEISRPCLVFFCSDKDIDCDIRENIINYEDEGGGEVDQAGYDLSVLRMMSNGTPAIMHPGAGGTVDGKLLGKMPHHPHATEAAPDIQTFLQTNKVRKPS